MVGGRQLFRSNKKLPTLSRTPLSEGDYGEGDLGDDGASTASWSTVASTTSTTVGGASLLSGVSGYSVTTGSINGVKKPWRQLSASKKAGETAGTGVGRNRRKKEKLRRVYADLDRHEVE